ncbi:hypothetical protein [Streptomyces sp. NPDC008092]|uniref:hypothetical protein n=1 Tax=Streptomyces sp. NPDC008092 TaxID=3364808 RepID=UPI0036E75AC4
MASAPTAGGGAADDWTARPAPNGPSLPTLQERPPRSTRTSTRPHPTGSIPSPLVRRGYNYRRSSDGQGLIPSCFQRDLEKGFEAVQQQLQDEATAICTLTAGGGYFFVPHPVMARSAHRREEERPRFRQERTRSGLPHNQCKRPGAGGADAGGFSAAGSVPVAGTEFRAGSGTGDRASGAMCTDGESAAIGSTP